MLHRLTGLASAPVPAGLLPWARRIAAPAGPLPLLGTGLRAQPWPALLWNGARLHAAGAPDADGLLLVALAAAPPDATGADVERALGTGLAVSYGLAGVVGAGTPIGRPSTGAVAAAACAAVAGGGDPADLGAVLDVAASLMVVQPPEGGPPLQAGLWSGHCLAAGWLAPRVLGAGVLGMAGALRDTVSTVTGRPAGELGLAPVPATPGAPARRAGDLLAALT